MKKTAVLALMTVALAAFKIEGYKVGDKAMNFHLKNVDGNMVSLSDYKDAKGFIVVFTCNHCPYAKAYEDRVIALNTKYKPKGYPVIAINANDPNANPDDDYATMQQRAKAKNYDFPYVVDGTQEIARNYGAAHTPHVFVLQKSGSDYLVKYIGAIDDSWDEPSTARHRYVEEAVDALLAGQPVSVPFTKAIGCGIKWKT